MNVELPRFTCAPIMRMPHDTFPIFLSNVKAVAHAMSHTAAFVTRECGESRERSQRKGN
jgi:hypothetical protein